MNTHHVFYNDTEIGFQTFESRDAAIEFINDRLAASGSQELGNYKLIEGEILPLHAAERITIAAVDEDALKVARAQG